MPHVVDGRAPRMLQSMLLIVSFLLFSTGRRNCVGQSLALAEITWVLSRLCAKYDFEVIDEGHQEFCVTLKCVGATLKARRRQDRSKIQ